MYSAIRENWRIFSKYFWDPGELTEEQVQQRELFFMNEWLIHRKFRKLSSNQYSAVQLEIFALFEKYFFNSEIYKNLKPSKFAEKTLLNPLFLENPLVKQIVILSKNITETQKKSKEKFIREYFNHPKITFIDVPHKENKLDAIKENNINFNVLIDDEIPNIRLIAENYEDLHGKEFIIPKYGYNAMPKELAFLIESRGGSYTYYEPFKKEGE